MRNVVVLNGPNLNLLGTREPEIYGSSSLEELDAKVIAWGTDLGMAVETFQTNHEGALIDRIHAAGDYADGIVINAGALTHYSYALHDALRAVGLPAVEVHLSNVRAREVWRAHSVIAPACSYSIFGRGAAGYGDALRHLRWSSAHPAFTIRYGPGDEHLADLRIPQEPGPHPIAIVIHGGFWRDVWTRDLMDGMAVDLARRGWATWNIEYRRLGSGGGWPHTVDDVADAADHLQLIAAEHDLDLERVVSIGHSAGGHLALWLAARPRLTVGTSGAGPRTHVAAAVGLAPVADLAEAHRLGLGGGAVDAFLRRTPADGPERYANASPIQLVPLGVKQVLIHGDEDDRVPVAMSEAYAGAAADAGDEVVYHELSGVGHFEILDPESEPWKVTAAELTEVTASSP